MALAAAIASPSAQAGEGASSYYIGGASGTFLVAVPPEPGLYVTNRR